jgi:zinc protease
MSLHTSDFKLQTYSGLGPTRTVLENGLVVLAKQSGMTPAVTIHAAVRAGSAADSPGLAGGIWLLSRVIDRGTATRSAGEIAEDLDSRGITLTVTVTRHLVSIICTCLAEDFEPVLALVGDVLMAPAIPAAELTTRKGEVITAIRQDEDNPGVRATETLMAQLYPNEHPYGRRTKGSIDTVESLTRDRLLALHRERFAPSTTTTVVVGDVEPARAHAAAERVFGSWSRSTVAELTVPPVARATTRRRLVLPMMNKAQADVAYGFTTIARRDPRYYAYWLMNNVFGQYALGGRLGDSIRERQGMAYYVSSSLDANVVEGPLVIRAGVSPANVDRAIASIDDEVAALSRDGVTQAELDDSRQFLIGSIPRALETNAAIANFLQIEEFFGLGLDYDVRLPDLLRAVTRDDALAAARDAVAIDRATIVVAGPYAET